MVAPLLFILTLAVSGIAGSPPAHAVEPCVDQLEEFERVYQTVEAGPEADQQVQTLWQAARQLCVDGREDEARQHLNEAWSTLLGDTALKVPAVDEVRKDTCSQGMQAVVQLQQESTVSEMARDAADRLMRDARLLCEEGRPQAAQNKLAMAWSMLTGVPSESR